MVAAFPVRVLSISDQVNSVLQSPEAVECHKNVDLILACGDLPYYYIENVLRNFNVPTFFVRGNHDHPLEYGAKGTRREPRGAIDLHNRLVNYNNLLMAGFEGSVRYREGPFMYSQAEMWVNVLGLVPRLLWNKLVHGRFLDVLITHAPPWGIHDQPDVVHQGFKAFIWFLKMFKPSYHFHGHIHIYEESQPSETVFHVTKVINTYGYRESIIYRGKRHFAVGAPARVRPSNLTTALDDFRDARRRAALQSVLSALSGKSVNLMPFKEVSTQLGSKTIQSRGLQKIPLDAIVGSVGRYVDFTRKFFPRRESTKDRWVSVKTKFASIETMPPIEVYQIGEAYFVLDGNHRVSVARQNKETHIRANVTEIGSKVPLLPDDQPDDIIIKVQQVKFLRDTRLDVLRPEIDFSVSAAGRYRQLREHISSHHFILELDRGGSVAFEDAVVDWVDNVYIPLVREISKLGLLRDFPGRTPTDLFLWLVRNQRKVAEEIGWQIEPERVAKELRTKFGSHPRHVFVRMKEGILGKLRPQNFEAGPPPGNWRKAHAIPREDDRIFSASLVAISGELQGWLALEQALLIAKKENGIVRGAHILSDGQVLGGERFVELRRKFDRYCRQNDISGEFVVERGDVAFTITDLARWNDLVVFGLAHPPSDQLLARLRSGLRSLIQTSPRPVLAVPAVSPMQSGLLAYDGSLKADEAMFMAAYLAQKWGIELVVVTAVSSSAVKPKPLTRSKQYLSSRSVRAKYIHRVGHPGDVILETADESQSDFIIMGGYGFTPLLEVVLGSTVDQVLRGFDNPVLICR